MVVQSKEQQQQKLDRKAWTKQGGDNVRAVGGWCVGGRCPGRLRAVAAVVVVVVFGWGAVKRDCVGGCVGKEQKRRRCNAKAVWKEQGWETKRKRFKSRWTRLVGR